MKRFLLLLLLLATPARADDSISALSWNSAKGTFQALTRALGWKDVPDHETGTFYIATTGAVALASYGPITYTRIGKMVLLIFPATGLQTCTSAVFNAAAGQIPAGLRPSTNTARSPAVPINNAGADTQNGEAIIGTTGNLQIYASISGTGNWTAGNCQVYAFPFIYSTNS